MCDVHGYLLSAFTEVRNTPSLCSFESRVNGVGYGFVFTSYTVSSFGYDIPGAGAWLDIREYQFAEYLPYLRCLTLPAYIYYIFSKTDRHIKCDLDDWRFISYSATVICCFATTFSMFHHFQLLGLA